MLICGCFAGDVFAKGGAEQGDSVPDAPEQHPWCGGHVHVGRAARSRHHAQPLSALQKGQHLCECKYKIARPKSAKKLKRFCFS